MTNEARHGYFLEQIDRLGAIFSNLSAPPAPVLEEWYRVFRETPIPALRESVSRAIERHPRAKILPAELRAYLDEVLRDQRGSLEAIPDAIPLREACSDPDCPRCGGDGVYRSSIEVHGKRLDLTVVCVPKKEGEA